MPWCDHGPGGGQGTHGGDGHTSRSGWCLGTHRAKGERRELSNESPARSRGPGLRDGGAGPPGGVRRHVHQPLRRRRRVRLHAVVGGAGPPLLLVHGWPETRYAWRLLMAALARDFQVVAVDQRGMGLSDEPEDARDTWS